MKNRFVVCFVLFNIFTLFVQSCFTQSHDNRISNGIEASPHQFPYHVLLIYRDTLEYIGGGVLIDAYWVLTAEHCIPPDWKPRIMAGYVNRSDPYRDGGYIVEFDEAHRFSEKGVEGDHDIALIKLREPLFEKDNIKHVRLVRKNEATQGQLAYVAGHGYTTEYSKSEIMLFTELRIQDPYCTPTYICTEENHYTSGTCPGDSGGPLVLKGTNILLGVLHAGDKSCGDPNKKSYFSNVNLYFDWITEITGLVPM